MAFILMQLLAYKCNTPFKYFAKFQCTVISARSITHENCTAISYSVLKETY